MVGVASGVNGRDWRQEWYETGDPAIRTRATQLRRLNVTVAVRPMGRQLTECGVVKMTLVDIRRNGADECIWDRIISTTKER